MNSPDNANTDRPLPQDLQDCMAFHGHLCPGLVYGYLVAKEAASTLKLSHARDEEVVVISENDTCAVDAIQVLLGTTTGKGNLILKDYGKSVFTVMHRAEKRALRFSRKSQYLYEGAHEKEFSRLEAILSAGEGTLEQRWRQKWLKALDLLAKPIDAVFETREVAYVEPPYAPLAPSKACARCGEMTMATKLVPLKDGRRSCIPCAQERPLSPKTHFM